MKPKISVVVFDLGNVLLPFDYSIAIARLNSISPDLGNKFSLYSKENYQFHRSFERGDISNEDFISQMLKALDNKIDSKCFCEIYSEIFIENKPVTNLLPFLKKHYKLILLSNTNAIHQKYGWQKYKFLKYFDKLILSNEINAVKPEEKIYRAAEEFSGQPSAEHLFIDDILEYANAAQNIGWHAINYKSPELLIKGLTEKGILYNE